MIPELRRQFNQRWTPEAYRQLLTNLDAAVGAHVSFRICETPVFLPNEMVGRMVRYGRELYHQLVGNPEYLGASRAAVPEGYKLPNEINDPLFLQADFGLALDPDGRLEPKLVEIQAFPTIYAFQAQLAQEYERIFAMQEYAPDLTPFTDGFVFSTYKDLLGRAILGTHIPDEVVLLEIDPFEQKTLPDFLATQKLFGIRIADIRQVKKKGTKLHFEGREIKRIYNRVIVDELVRKGIKPEFRFSDELDVEWAGDPEWFFRISKFSLPWLKHKCVPETWFLNELPGLPDNLDEFVLKPLYSFAGLGVTIGPTRADVEAIPEEKRNEYILQRKVNFVPTVETPAGPTKVEVRIMYVRDSGEMKALAPLLRLGRGKMMGVDFNKDLDWVGASAGFFLRGW